MERYANGKIYKIVGGNECYVGSTCKKLLSQRMVQHRGDFEKYLRETSHYVSIYDLFFKYGVENCKIKLLELCPCSCNDELRKKEQEWINKLECVNIINAYLSKEDLLKLRNEIQKKYYEKNKKIITEKTKIYQQTHKEEIAKRTKIYRDKHKEQISEKNSVKIDCLCGGKYTFGNTSNHKKTIIHQNYLKKQLVNSSETLEKNDTIEYADCV
jgi:hypothetical protein